MRSGSQQVEVYDAKTCTLQRHVSIPGLGVHRGPCGLAACDHYQCLYASDFTNNRIHRAELTGSNAVMEWSVASGPRGLSVNQAHNVVVACWKENEAGLLEYTTHGTLVREFSPKNALTEPWHAVQLSTGDYVVSHWTSPTVVSVVGANGQVVRRCGPSIEQLVCIRVKKCFLHASHSSDLGQMEHPTSLAVTKNDDIFVADSGNNRILSLDSSLSSAHELALPVDVGIERPCGLCLDESRGRLYISEGRKQRRVLVFDGV